MKGGQELKSDAIPFKTNLNPSQFESERQKEAGTHGEI
jgi:hypothetical protein